MCDKRGYTSGNRVDCNFKVLSFRFLILWKFQGVGSTGALPRSEAEPPEKVEPSSESEARSVDLFQEECAVSIWGKSDRERERER